jgi:hypothetical protein
MSYTLGSGQVESDPDRPIIHFGSPQGSDYPLPTPPEPEPAPEEEGGNPARGPQPKPEKPPLPPKNPNRHRWVRWLR